MRRVAVGWLRAAVTGEPGPGEAGPGELPPGELAPAEAGAGQLRPGEPVPGQLEPGEAGSGGRSASGDRAAQWRMAVREPAVAEAYDRAAAGSHPAVAARSRGLGPPRFQTCARQLTAHPVSSAAVLPRWGAAVVAVVAGAVVIAAPVWQPLLAAQTETTTADVTIKVERDGRLTVDERVTVPDGTTATRQIRLRQPVGDDLDRTFEVTGTTVDNGGTVGIRGDSVQVTFRPGESALRYTVDGAVADVGQAQEVRWVASGGWDVEVGTVTVGFAAPAPSASLTCFAGPAGSSTACTLAQISHTQLTTAREDGLAAGERVELVVGLPAGTVPANLRLDETFSLARAFRLTPAIGLVLLGLVLALLAGLALLWRARRRDAAALQAAGTAATGYEPLVRTGDRVQFASPEGVLPGQIGTIVDGHVDVVDVAATVVDLAVRNYLWLAEGPGQDWLIVRRNPPDESLRQYERAVYDALLGGADQDADQNADQGADRNADQGADRNADQDAGRDRVRVGRLRESAAPALPGIRDELYADVVHAGWLRRRPDSNLTVLGRVGLGVAVAGVALTVLLAAFTTVALLGLAVVVAGVALWLGARYLPARTALGSRLLGQLVVLRDYLHTVDAHALPDADREVVFSRSLPYAVVLGETGRWLATFADLDPAVDGTPGLYWYGAGGTGAAGDLRQFADRFPAFVAALDGALAEAGHLRSLAAAPG